MFFEKKEKMDSHLLQVCSKVSLWLEGKWIQEAHTCIGYKILRKATFQNMFRLTNHFSSSILLLLLLFLLFFSHLLKSILDLLYILENM